MFERPTETLKAGRMEEYVVRLIGLEGEVQRRVVFQGLEMLGVAVGLVAIPAIRQAVEQ